MRHVAAGHAVCHYADQSKPTHLTGKESVFFVCAWMEAEHIIFIHFPCMGPCHAAGSSYLALTCWRQQQPQSLAVFTTTWLLAAWLYLGAFFFCCLPRMFDWCCLKSAPFEDSESITEMRCLLTWWTSNLTKRPRQEKQWQDQIMSLTTESNLGIYFRCRRLILPPWILGVFDVVLSGFWREAIAPDVDTKVLG